MGRFLWIVGIPCIAGRVNDGRRELVPRLPLGSLLSVPLIAYGILKTYLFDIDLRVKWTLQRSTLAAIFVAIVYLVSEAADRFFSAELGSVAGLLIAAGVVFFLAPLQRVANAAMPSTQDTPAYAAFKKLQVYEAARELEADAVSDRPRALPHTVGAGRKRLDGRDLGEGGSTGWAALALTWSEGALRTHGRGGDSAPSSARSRDSRARERVRGVWSPS